jgi:YHS domain-containing protein
MLKITSALFLIPALALVPVLQAQDHGGHGNSGGHDDGHGDSHAKKEAPEFKGDPYLLDTDPVTQKKLAPARELQVIKHEGRELRFNDAASLKTFKADPGKYLPAVDAALISQQLPHYPLKTCVVSGEALGEMGAPLDVLYRNRLVRLCCKGCKKDFKKNPSALIAKVEKATIAAQRAHYPMDVCVTSGEKLGEDGAEIIETVVGNRLFLLCCPPCEKSIAKDPLTYLARLDKAAGKKSGEHGDGHGDGHDHDH